LIFNQKRGGSSPSFLLFVYIYNRIVPVDFELIFAKFYKNKNRSETMKKSKIALPLTGWFS